MAFPWLHPEAPDPGTGAGTRAARRASAPSHVPPAPAG